MKPKQVHKVKSIVSYHWSPKKRRQMQRKVNRVTEPLELQTLEEVWATLRERKAEKLGMTSVLSGLHLERSYAREEAKEPLASPPRASPPRASPPRADTSALSTENVARKDWSFVADDEVLVKELDLGRELLAKAAAKVTAPLLREIATGAALSDVDQALVLAHETLLDTVEGRAAGEHPWEQTAGEWAEHADEQAARLSGFADLVERNRVSSEQTRAVKEQFIAASSQNDTSAQLEPLREFLCEAFCLIDIMEELALAGSPTKPEHSLQQLASPSHEAQRVGIDHAMISPIPTRESGDLGGQSVNRYVDVSHEVTVDRLARSPPKPKRQLHSLAVEEQERDALDRSMSPSRDLARKMEHTDKVAQKSRFNKKTKHNKVRSPTKRLMQMKNANLKNSQKAAVRNDTDNKLLYTVSPTQGYLVKKEYSPNMNADDM